MLGQAQKYLDHRNSDVAEILSGARLGLLGVDIDSQFHHIFW